MFKIKKIDKVTVVFHWLIAFSSRVDLKIFSFCLKVYYFSTPQYFWTKLTNLLSKCPLYNRYNFETKRVIRCRNIQLLVGDVYRPLIFVTLDSNRVYSRTDCEGTIHQIKYPIAYFES